MSEEKTTKTSYDAEVKEYKLLFKDSEHRNSNYGSLVSTFYDSVTDLYEFGWGESFHFAPRHALESREQSIARFEHFIATKLDLKDGMRVLDIGCGVGGPQREISRFSGAKVTGVNISELQVAKGKKYNKQYGLDHLCDMMVGDFHKLPFEDGTFDAVYCIEASCHSPHREKVFAEAYRVLKPDGRFLTTEWCTTDKYDPQNSVHQKVKEDIEYGNGLSNTISTKESLKKLKDVGFQVLHEKDYCEVDKLNPVPWYREFDRNLSLSGFASSWLGIWILWVLVSILEFIHLAPKGTSESEGVLQVAARSLMKGGKLGIYTVAYLIMGQKPSSGSKQSNK